MKRIIGLIPLLPTLLLVLFTGPVSADMTFHTQRLTFSVTAAGLAAGNPQPLTSQVVDVHPDGPQIGALEQYMINGAKANSAYQVVLHLFSGSCSGNFFATISTALLTTDSVGFATGSHVFTATELAGFNGLSFGIFWTLDTGAISAYDTVCIPVSVG